MSGSDERIDELLERLVLDIKAFVLLQGSDDQLRTRLQRGLSESRDESLRRFVGSLQSRRRPGSGRLLAIAMGELILASLLVVAGTVALIPTTVGLSSPQGLVNYFAGQLYGSLANSPLYQYTGFIEFVLGALLILSAFYTLRQAALDLKEMGLSVKTGE